MACVRQHKMHISIKCFEKVEKKVLLIINVVNWVWENITKIDSEVFEEYGLFVFIDSEYNF